MASEVNYRKSKFSSGSDGNCIEAGNDAEHVFIRDTKLHCARLHRAFLMG